MRAEDKKVVDVNTYDEELVAVDASRPHHATATGKHTVVGVRLGELPTPLTRKQVWEECTLPPATGLRHALDWL